MVRVDSGGTICVAGGLHGVQEVSKVAHSYRLQNTF